MLINQQCRVKICDFGLARSLNHVYEDPQHPALTEYVGKFTGKTTGNSGFDCLRFSSNEMVSCTGNSPCLVEVNLASFSMDFLTLEID